MVIIKIGEEINNRKPKSSYFEKKSIKLTNLRKLTKIKREETLITSIKNEIRDITKNPRNQNGS